MQSLGEHVPRPQGDREKASETEASHGTLGNPKNESEYDRKYGELRQGLNNRPREPTHCTGVTTAYFALQEVLKQPTPGMRST
jgi:hypothetical protein